MRDSSYNSYTQTKQIHSRGGEKKVMKKSLSLLLAISLVFGLFASMASAADAPALTTAEKYKWFVDAGILKGTPDGGVHEADKLTRAEFATIAVAAAGLTAATSGQTFSDVKKGQWYYGAIEAAAKAGLVNGIGSGKFGPKTNVTIESIIKVAVLIAGLKPVAGATVAGASDWAAPYVKAALDAGLTTAQASYKGLATRGDVINIAFAVVQIKSVPTMKDVKATVGADDTITVTGTVYGKADSVKVALGTATAVAATLKADGTFSYKIAAQAAGTYAITVIAYDGAKASATSTLSVTIDGLTVSSVTLLNAKQIAVKFSKALQEGTAAGGYKNLTYYVLGAGSLNPTAADLSDDKMTVTLTFANAFGGFAANSYQQFTVGTVKSVSGKTVTAYKQAILLTDVTAPSVTGVSYSGGAAKISFSEPLGSVGTISVNGNAISTSGSIYYTANANDAAHGGNINSVTVYGLAAATNYSFYLISGADVSIPANLFDYNTTLNVPADSVAPTVTSVTVSGGVITVKFSEDISNAGTVYSTGFTAVNGVVDGSSATYNVAAWLGTNNFSTLSAKFSGYKDLVGNTGSDYTTSVTISKDTTKPTVVSVMYTGSEVVFKFSEKIDATSVITATYTYTDTSTVVKTGSLVNPVFGYDADNSDINGTPASDEYVYVKYATGAIGAGTYAYTIGGFKDVNGNNGDSASPSLTVTASTTTSGIVKATSISQTGLGKLQFVFDHKLTTAALDVNKYLINGVALPAGTKLYFLNDLYTVVAELPAGAVPVSGQRTLKVQNIVDESGNTLNTSNSTFYQGLVNLTENVKPIAGAITVVSDTAITVSFNETLTTDAAITGVEVYVNGSTTKVANLTYSASGTTLSISGGNDTFGPAQTIVVKFVGTDLADFVGNKLANGQVSK